MPSTATPAADSGADDPRARFTAGLLFDVFAVLEKHGFEQPTEQQARNRATGAALGALLRLVEIFEGREI